MSAPWKPPATAEALARQWELSAVLMADAEADALRECAAQARAAGDDPHGLLLAADALEARSRTITDGMRRYGWTPEAEAGAVTSQWCALRLRATAEAMSAGQPQATAAEGEE